MVQNVVRTSVLSWGWIQIKEVSCINLILILKSRYFILRIVMTRLSVKKYDVYLIFNCSSRGSDFENIDCPLCLFCIY